MWKAGAHEAGMTQHSKRAQQAEVPELTQQVRGTEALGHKARPEPCGGPCNPPPWFRINSRCLFSGSTYGLH